MSGYFKCGKCLKLFIPTFPTDSICRACSSLASATGSDSGTMMIVDEDRVNYLARKFYPHLTPTYGRLCILESLRANLSPND